MTDNTNDANAESQLFEKCDVHTVPLVEYVRWFIDSSHPRHNLVQLPPIQRGAVWKVAQVERLWDSLLRGFPIGSFVLAPRCKGDAARSTESRRAAMPAEQRDTGQVRRRVLRARHHLGSAVTGSVPEPLSDRLQVADAGL